MNKNSLIAVITVLIILCIGEAYFINRERNEKIALSMSAQKNISMAKPKTSAKPKPMFVMKGQKFSDSPLFSKAHLIFPITGSLSADAQTALTGWTVKTKANSDGSTQVDLIPKESEDVRQSFTVKQGYKLYFIELTLVDDQTGIDENRGDDIGVLVDNNGMVQ